MTEQEAKLCAERVQQFNALKGRLDSLRTAYDILNNPDQKGPSQQNPFTGNTRESRRVASMFLKFTKTRGGAAAVEQTVDLSALGLEAHDLQRWLNEKLESKIKELRKEADEL